VKIECLSVTDEPSGHAEEECHTHVVHANTAHYQPKHF
jgi:hypothetical protein